MKKPRTAFAAPFVVVLACGQPQERPRHPEPAEDDEAESPAVIDAAVVDASIDAPIDAAADARPARKVTAVDECKDYKRYGVICNPPGPRRARVLKVEVAGSAYVVTFAAGSDDGITKDFRVRFIDDLGRRSNAECTIIGVTRSQSTCKYTSTQPASATVELNPP